MFAGRSVSGETVVGVKASVGADAAAFGSVLFDSATVGEDAVVRVSVLCRGGGAAPSAVLGEAVVGDGAFIAPSDEVACGIRVSPTHGSSRPPPASPPMCDGRL